MTLLNIGKVSFKNQESFLQHLQKNKKNDILFFPREHRFSFETQCKVSHIHIVWDEKKAGKAYKVMLMCFVMRW